MASPGGVSCARVEDNFIFIFCMFLFSVSVGKVPKRGRGVIKTSKSSQVSVGKSSKRGGDHHISKKSQVSKSSYVFVSVNLLEFLQCVHSLSSTLFAYPWSTFGQGVFWHFKPVGQIKDDQYEKIARQSFYVWMILESYFGS